MRTIQNTYGVPAQCAASQPKRKKKRKGRKRRQRGVPRVMKCYTRGDVQALTRCIAAQVACTCVPGSKPRPYDISSRPSIAMRLYTRKSFTTDAQGRAVVQISPTLHENIRVASTIDPATATVSAWGTPTDADGYDATLFSGFRITSMCVRYVGSTALDESSGRIAIVQSGTVSNAPYVGTTTFPTSLFVAQQGADVMACVHPEGPEAGVFKDIDSTDPGGLPFTYVMADVAHASTNIGWIEVVQSVEMHLETNSALNQATTPAAPFVPQLEAAVSRARGNAPAIIDNSHDPQASKKTIWSVAEDAAVELLEGLTSAGVATLIGLI